MYNLELQAPFSHSGLLSLSTPAIYLLGIARAVSQAVKVVLLAWSIDFQVLALLHLREILVCNPYEVHTYELMNASVGTGPSTIKKIILVVA